MNIAGIQNGGALFTFRICRIFLIRFLLLNDECILLTAADTDR